MVIGWSSALFVSLLLSKANSCRLSEFLCGTGRCIPITHYCDGTSDCLDGADEPRMCTPCNRTFYGDVGKTYEFGLHRPKDNEVPFVCNFVFTAEGEDYGDLIQITFQSFTLGKFVSFVTDGCHEGSLEIKEVDRPRIGGRWCGMSSGPTVYYSETKTVTLTLRLLKSKDKGIYDFDIKIGYKMLTKESAVVRYGVELPPLFDTRLNLNNTILSPKKPPGTGKYFLGDLISGTYCSRIFTDCNTKICKLQSPNFPGIYPRNLTCYYAVRQNKVPPGKHALISVRQKRGQLIAIRSSTSLYSRTQQQPSLAPKRELKVWSECDEVQDYVTVYDGYTTRDPVLLKFCGIGEAIPETISSGPELLVEFTTSPYGTFQFPAPAQIFHGFQLEVKVYFIDQEMPYYTRNKKCEFNLKGVGKGVLESPHHTLSPNTTCTYYLEGTDAPKTTPAFRPTPGRYPIKYDPKFWQKPTPPPPPPPFPSRYRVWFSILKFNVAPPRVKTTEECSIQLQIWDGNLREACNDAFCEKEKVRAGIQSNTISSKKGNATMLAQYCKSHVPKTCDHSMLTSLSRFPRPCSITESFLSTGNSMTLQLKLVDSTALRSVSFKALYEFVDLHQDGEAFGKGPCSRKFVSRSQGPMQNMGQKFQSPKDIFLFGRGGNTNLSCVYRFEGQKGERVKLNIQNLKTGGRPCKSLYHQDINRIRCHGNATAALRIYEYPWIDSLGVPRDCLCSGGDGITPFSFTSSTHIVEVRFDLENMNSTDDYRNLHFEGSWEFVRQTVCTREQREKGPSGEIYFRSPSRTPEEINCESQPWMIEPATGKFLYVKVKGVLIEKDLISYEDVVNNVSISSKLPKCNTKNRILIYSGQTVYSVVCPDPAPADKHRVAEVFSEGWVVSEEESIHDSLLIILDADKRKKILRSRNVIVEYLGKEKGSYKVKWLELSRRKSVLPPEGYVMKDCFHRCPELDACINSSLWCDGVTHCPSGYDESIRHCYEIFQLPALYLAFGAIGMLCLLCAACLFLYRSCRRRAKRRQCRLKTLPSDSSVFEDKEVIC